MGPAPSKKLPLRIALAAVALAVASCAAPRRAAGPCRRFHEIVRAELDGRIPAGERSFELTIVDRRTGDTLCSDSVEPGRSLYPASTIKTLIAVAALRLVDAGKLRLDAPVTIDQPPAFAADECRERAGDPSCAVFGPGKTVTVDQLLTDMMTISNNLAADQLIDVVSKPFLAQTARDLGAPSLRAVRKLYNNIDPEPDARVSNAADAAGMTELFRELVSGRRRVLSEKSRAYLVGLLRREQFHDYFNRDFPPSAVYHHKYGFTSHAMADVGFYDVGVDRAAILVGLARYTRHDPERERDAWSLDQDAAVAAFARIGRQTLDLTGPCGNIR